ncbi:MAG: hypothetical protein WD802_06875 [Gemmatimonadaceae bacterium]
MPVNSARIPYRNLIVAAVITAILTNVIFGAVGFRYRWFSEPFDFGKLAIDLGTWIVIYTLSFWAVSRASART